MKRGVFLREGAPFAYLAVGILMTGPLAAWGSRYRPEIAALSSSIIGVGVGFAGIASIFNGLASSPVINP